MKNEIISYKLIDEGCRYWVLSKSIDGKTIEYVEGSITILEDGRISWSGIFFNDNSVKFPDQIFTEEEFKEGLIKKFNIVRVAYSDKFNYIPKNIIAFEKLPGGMYLSHSVPILIHKSSGVPYFCEDPDYLKTEYDFANEKKFSEEEYVSYNKRSRRKIKFLKWYSCEKIKDREFIIKRTTYDALYLFETIPIFKKNINISKKRKETKEDYES